MVPRFCGCASSDAQGRASEATLLRPSSFDGIPMLRLPAPLVVARGLALASLTLASSAGGNLFAQYDVPTAPVEQVFNFEQDELGPQLAETTALIRANLARSTYGVNGSGLTIAVFDTGINTTHVDFAGRIRGGRNFTTEDGGNPAIYEDRQGHGTNCAGISMARGTVYTGIAPGAQVYVYKVLDDTGSGNFTWMRDALAHLVDNRAALKVTTVNMSIGDGQNWLAAPTGGVYDEIRALIEELRSEDVVVCISAGNSFFNWGSAQGMGFPAICDSSTSVGAVYDSDIGPVSYGSGAIANTTGARRITPFTQRIHPSASALFRTDMFAPGAALSAPGIGTPTSGSTFHGTSQASPCLAGVALLMQNYHLKRTGEMPSVDEIEAWMRASSLGINDGDDENDNVTNTGLNYPLIDALAALNRVHNATKTGPDPPNRKPVANAGRNIVITTNLERGARVTLDGRGSSDPDGDRLKFFWKATGIVLSGKTSARPSGLFPIGSKNAVLTVTDPGRKKDTDLVRITVRLKNGKPRPRGAAADIAFDESERLATRALAGGAGPEAATGLAYTSLAIGYGDAAGEFVRWEEGQSQVDALYSYVELRSLQSLHGAAATQALIAAYAESGDEGLLAAAGHAAYATLQAAADSDTP